MPTEAVSGSGVEPADRVRSIGLTVTVRFRRRSVSPGHSAIPNAVASGAGTERPEGYIVGQPAREQSAPHASARTVRPDDVQPGYALRPGEWQPTPEPPRPKKHDDKQDKDDDKHSDKHKKSLAEKRGPDWGLRDAARGSVGVTRPIRVECYADRLVVFSERGPAGNKVIPFGPRTQSSIEPLVSAVWDCIERGEWPAAACTGVPCSNSMSPPTPSNVSPSCRPCWRAAG